MKAARKESGDSTSTSSNRGGGSRVIQNESMVVTTSTTSAALLGSVDESKRSSLHISAAKTGKSQSSTENGDGRKSKRPKSSSNTAKGTPNYGSQEYWDERYRRQFAEKQKSAKKEDDGIGNDNNNNDEAVDETLPYHAWYFTYDDLRPLILPLILGGRNDVYNILQKAEEEDQAEEDNDDDNDDDDEEYEEETPDDNNQEDNTAKDESSRGDDQEKEGEDETESQGEGIEPDEDDECVEVDDDDDDEDEEEDVVEREGLSKNGPISVIEIGCGDVPLGAGLALELKELETQTGASTLKVVKEICCTDYSRSVVSSMQAQYRSFAKDEIRPKHSADIGNVPLKFVVADARKLDYDNRRFELILEKGTLDAMLSDQKDGVQNCVQIMRECARVLAINGYIVLVSHLNAHTERGIGWLQDVVFEGLRGGDPESGYVIEVHGNSEVQEDSKTALPGTPGPAVYIIRKKEKETSCEVEEENTSIPVKFFAY